MIFWRKPGDFARYLPGKQNCINLEEWPSCSLTVIPGDFARELQAERFRDNCFVSLFQKA